MERSRRDSVSSTYVSAREVDLAEQPISSSGRIAAWLEDLPNDNNIKFSSLECRQRFIDWVSASGNHFLHIDFEPREPRHEGEPMSLRNYIRDRLSGSVIEGAARPFVLTFSGIEDIIKDVPVDKGTILRSLALQLATAMWERGLRLARDLRTGETFKTLLEEVPMAATVWCVLEDVPVEENIPDDRKDWATLYSDVVELNRLVSQGPWEGSSPGQGSVLKVLIANRRDTNLS